MRGFKNTLIIWVANLLSTNFALATIYGEDSFRPIAPQTVPTIGIQTLHFENAPVTDLLTKLSSKSLKDKGICTSEHWAAMTTVGHCGGEMVTSEWLLTSAHCIPSSDACAQARWVFPDKAFENYAEGPNGFLQVPTEQVVYCEKIIASSHKAHLDYALVKVSSPRNHYQTPKRPKRTPQIGDTLHTYSYPLGTSLKYSEGQVRKISSEQIFETNLDLMRGFSGSPVYSSQGEWVGLAARGDRDYEGGSLCHEIKRCGNEECRGEEVVSLTAILDDLKSKGIEFESDNGEELIALSR